MARIVNELQTPFDEPAMDAPDAAGNLASRRGGRPEPQGPGGVGLVSSPHESNVPAPGGGEDANTMSGLPGRVDGIDAGEGDPGIDAAIPLPDLNEAHRGRTLD